MMWVAQMENARVGYWDEMRAFAMAFCSAAWRVAGWVLLQACEMVVRSESAKDEYLESNAAVEWVFRAAALLAPSLGARKDQLWG